MTIYGKFEIEPWIETRSGKMFHFLDPKDDEIDVADIAYALAHQCRFNGHTSHFFSVAEHSVLVASLVPDEFKLAALLHDAAEAYLSDIPSPIKQFLPQYKEMEAGIMAAIERKFGVDASVEEVKKADFQQLRTEAHYLLESGGETWNMWDHLEKPKVEDGRQPLCLPPIHAFGTFMAAFNALTKKEEEKPRLIVVK